MDALFTMFAQFPRRFVAVVVLAVGCASVACASGGADEPDWSTTETKTELRLTESSPERIVGTFTRAGITVSFEARKTEGAHSLILRSADGRVLVSTAGIGDTRVISMLDGRLTISPRTNDLAQPEALAKIGDQDAFAELLLSPESTILPWLSRALGEKGITGVSHPASLDLHTFSALAARAREIEVPSLDAASIPGNEERGAQSSCNRPTANQCYGMCGKGCNCWSWICGDCCYHGGCAAHDSDCRKCSWSNPWACTKCATMASFWTGGGC